MLVDRLLTSAVGHQPCCGPTPLRSLSLALTEERDTEKRLVRKQVHTNATQSIAHVEKHNDRQRGSEGERGRGSKAVASCRVGVGVRGKGWGAEYGCGGRANWCVGVLVCWGVWGRRSKRLSIMRCVHSQATFVGDQEGAKHCGKGGGGGGGVALPQRGQAQKANKAPKKNCEEHLLSFRSTTSGERLDRRSRKLLEGRKENLRASLLLLLSSTA